MPWSYPRWIARAVPLFFVASLAVLQPRLCTAQVYNDVTDHEGTERYLVTFKNAANKWRAVPVDLFRQIDPVSPDMRKLRDSFWDEAIGSEGSLLDPATPPRYFSNSDEGDYWLSIHPEFTRDPHMIWVIGRFDSYRCFLSSKEKSIYTEISFTVQSAFGAEASTLQVKPGASIDLASPGGTVLAAGGVVLSYAVEPQQNEMVPGGTYLLQLNPYATQQFFVVENQWDLSTGRAVPLTGVEKARLRTGKSVLAGMTAVQILKTLQLKYPVSK